VVSLVAGLRGHERQAVEELGQWKMVVEERKHLDASPTTITLAMLMTTAELEDLEKRSLELERSRRWSSARSARGANASSPRCPWLAPLPGDRKTRKTAKSIAPLRFAQL
jgi:hypothetical protein